MTPVVVAHAGHWLGQLLYLVPVAVLVIAVMVGRFRDRRADDAEDTD